VVGERDRAAEAVGGADVQAVQDDAVPGGVELVPLEVAGDLVPVGDDDVPERHGDEPVPPELGPRVVGVHGGEERPVGDDLAVPCDALVAAAEGGADLRAGRQDGHEPLVDELVEPVLRGRGVLDGDRRRLGVQQVADAWQMPAAIGTCNWSRRCVRFDTALPHQNRAAAPTSPPRCCDGRSACRTPVRW
jgi:hypothetical protein